MAYNLDTSRRKLPFPTTIDGCEQLLAETPQASGRRRLSLPHATMGIGDMPAPFEEPAHLPRHDTEPFTATGALVGPYGDKVLSKNNLVLVDCLSDPDDLTNEAHKIYKVSWQWARGIGAKAVKAEWYVEPRDENYSAKHIVGMALFRTYYNHLQGQTEAVHGWRLREQAVANYFRNRSYADLFDAIMKDGREHALDKVLVRYPDTTLSDFTEPDTVDLTEDDSAAAQTHLARFGTYTNYPHGS